MRQRYRALLPAVSTVWLCVLTTVASAQTLENTAWNAVEVAGASATSKAIAAGRELHLVFSPNRRLAGADGCNRLTGSYTLKGEAITFGPFAATQMACVTATDELARKFRSALAGTSRWSILNGRLQFFGATGKPLVVFERRREAASALQGTTWQLVEFLGGDDRRLKPNDPTKYTIEFAANGVLAAQIDCNRGRGSWKLTPPSQLDLAPMVLTRAKCPDGSLHDQIVRQWTSVRSFVIRNGHLFLSLMADAGTYEFAPVPAVSTPSR